MKSSRETEYLLIGGCVDMLSSRGRFCTRMAPCYVFSGQKFTEDPRA